MPRDARQVAQAALARIERGNFASGILGEEIDAAGLSPADRRLATELVYGVLRQRTRLDRALRAMLDRGAGKALREPIGTILRVGAYQILFLDRVPDHAAVNQAVRAARKARGQRVGGLVNAVLRRLGREGEPALPEGDDVESIAIRTATPEWIVRQVAAVLGSDELESAVAGLNAAAPLAVRVSRSHGSRESVAAALAEEVGERGAVEPSELAPDALIVTGLGAVAASPSFAAGRWTVQDVAAQLIAYLVAPRDGQRVLDACAGAGGKTTHLAELAPGSRIDAVDVSKSNLDRGRANAARLGVTNVAFHEGAVADVDGLAESYDAVLVDAPCTGLGVMRRHPEAKHRITPDDVAEQARSQRALLDAAASRVAPKGVLVYAVCTFTAAEGPDQIASLLERHPQLRIEAPPAELDLGALLQPDGSVRSWPHRHQADAFYAVRLRRTS